MRVRLGPASRPLGTAGLVHRPSCCIAGVLSAEEPGYALRVTGPAERQLNRLPEGTATAIVEFMLGALLENPHRLDGALQRELAEMRSARRGVYRIIYEIDDTERLVIVYRIEHRVTAYLPR